MSLQRWTGFVLLAVSSIFAYRMYRGAPWRLSIGDFLVQPILQFSLPLSIIGLLLCCLSPALWRSHLVLCGLLGTSLLVLGLQTGWPHLGHSTAWEDSYQMLFVLEVAIKGLCWPLWVSLALYMLYERWRKRQP